LGHFPLQNTPFRIGGSENGAPLDGFFHGTHTFLPLFPSSALLFNRGLRAREPLIPFKFGVFYNNHVGFGSTHQGVFFKLSLLLRGNSLFFGGEKNPVGHHFHERCFQNLPTGSNPGKNFFRPPRVLAAPP